MLLKILVQHVKNVVEPREQKLRRKMQVAGPLILHDNARPHREVLSHAPYSPDMSPPDCDLFPKLKEPMRGIRFSSLEEPSANVTRAIRHMNKSGILD